jgi:hypothetical protein
VPKLFSEPLKLIVVWTGVKTNFDEFCSYVMFHFGENNSTERKHNSAMDSSTTKMANVSATSSAPSTPISTLPQMNPFMDINHQVDESTMWDLQGSPGSKRCPTFKDYAEKVKQLQQENFQLRVRIFMNEQKTGIKTSSSDLAG